MKTIQSRHELRLCVLNASRRSGGFYGRWHKHPFFEIGFIFEGECIWRLRGRPSCVLRPGDLVVVPPECEHREFSNEKVYIGWIGFTGNDFSDAVPRRKVIRLGEAAGKVRFLLEHLYEEQRGGLARSEDISGLTLQHILLLIERAASAARPSGKREVLNGRQLQVVRAVASYLDQNADRPLTLEQVAGYHNLCAPHLSVLFRKYFGMTPTAYRMQKRIDLAKELLKEPGRSVKEVARACGYADAAHFCRDFKKAVSRTPGERGQ